MIYIIISEFWWNRITIIGCAFAISILIVILNKKSKLLHWREQVTEFDEVNNIIQSSRVAGSFLVINMNGVIVAINEKLKRMGGWKDSDLIGKTIDVIILKEYILAYEKFKIEHSTIEDYRSLEVEGVTALGVKIYLDITFLKWTNNVNWYYTVVLRDISHRIKSDQTILEAHKALARFDKIYHEGEKIGLCCFWQMDTQTGKIETTPNFGNIFGVKGQDIPVDSMIKRVMAEDRVRVAQIMATAKENKTGYDMQYKMVGLDGYLNTLHSVTSAIKNSRGDLISFIGCTRLIKKELPTWITQ